MIMIEKKNREKKGGENNKQGEKCFFFFSSQPIIFWRDMISYSKQAKECKIKMRLHQ